MKKILFHYSPSCKGLHKLLPIMTPGSKPKWKNICEVNSNPDYFVSIQAPNFSKPNTIHFRREPDIIKKWPQSVNGDNVYDYSTKEKFHACTWQLTKSYDELTSLKHFSKDLTSAVCSHKYAWRYKYIQEAIKHNPKIIGEGRPLSGKRISIEERTSLFLNSSMSICIENSSQSNYFTEKIIDALLAWCMPLYWGCPNIGDFFPEGSYRLIDIENPDSVSDLINKPITPSEIDAMHEARNLILNKYNIWECIYKTLN